MKTISLERIQYLLQKVSRHRQIVLALSAVVVFVTTYLLILPALTLDEETASTQGGIDVPQAQEEAAAVSPDILTFEGEGFDVSAECGSAALPSDTELVAEEIPEGTEDFDGYREEALKAVQDADGKKKANGFSFIRLYDISLYSEGAVIEPDAPVDVTISYNKPVKAGDADHVRIVHFGVDKKGALKTEVLDPEDVSVSMKKGKLQEASFTAESFSVYAVVYTVDFSFDVDGENFKYQMEGGGSASLRDLLTALHVAKADGSTQEEAVDSFLAEIEDVQFSDPDLMWIGKASEDTTVGALKEANRLECEYSADLTKKQIAEIDARTVSKGDWILISLKPFDSEETLTVTMKTGESFTVSVTDAQEISDSDEGTIDVNKSYLICYEVNGTYYLLKNDGTVDSSHTPANSNNFEDLNSSYCWMFNYIFTENDEDHNLEKNYYLIRPIDDRLKTLSLNFETSATEPLVQEGNNNVAVIPAEGGGFTLEGYHNIGNEENHRYVHLGFANGAFRGVDGDGVIVHIYEMYSLPTYDYTVRSADEERGSVSVRGGTQQTEQHPNAPDTHYYEATSNEDKKNDGIITATPVNHHNTHLQPGDEGYGQNKWEFDHWEQDGVPLDRNQYPATIQANTLPIPYNGSNLIAYFRQNPNYVVPPEEKEPSSIEDMSQWLTELEEKDIPLDEDATKKTAEVYDYENRIYRVDLATKANFQTFAGNLDMAFCLDVSNSMYFPSKLDKATVNHANPLPIYQINNSSQNKRWLNQNRTYDNPYYLIADPDGTATVFKIYYKEGNWRAIDASRTGEYENNTKRYFIIGQEDFSTNYGQDARHPFEVGDNDNTNYVIYDAGDEGNNRFHYLNLALGGGSTDLNTITELLKVAGAASPGVRIAYNTFNKDLGSQRQDFRPASTLQVQLSNSAGGGTRPDQAFNDAQNFNWQGEYTLDNNGDLSATDRYVILVTDGAPQGKRDNDPNDRTIEDLVREAAKNLKDNSHVKFITIGLSMENVTSGKRLLYDLADKDNSGNKMFYLAENASDLPNIFRQITKTLMEEVIVYSDITDTINDAFYIVDKGTGMPLKPGDKIDIEGFLTTDESKVAGIIQPDGKTILWKDQPVDHSAGWHGAVYVKAKEDLLGANAVKTNSGDAHFVATKYRASGKQDVYFDTTSVKEHLHLHVDRTSPKVNVNELIFPKKETEWTVYLGTEVDPKEQMKKLYENIYVEQVINEDDSLHYTIVPNSISDDRTNQTEGTAATFPLAPVILEHMISEGGEACAKYLADDGNGGKELNWDVFLEDILNGGVTVPYHPYGIEGADSNIVIKLEKNIDFDDENDPIPSHVTDTVGDGVEKYTLTARFNPDYLHVLPAGQGGTGSVDMHTGTYGSMYPGHASGRETSTNQHTINVFSVPLEVLKTDESDSPLAGAVFKLYKEDAQNGAAVAGLDSGHKYVEVASGTSGENGIVQLTKNNKAFGLTRGETYYLVESAAPQGYTKLDTVWAVQAQTEIGTFTDLDGNTIYSKNNPPQTAASGVTADMYPFNWDQGVRVVLDGKQPLTAIIKGSTEGSTTQSTDGSFISHEDAVSFRHTVLNKGGNISIGVNKVWEDEDFKPDSITVKLYRVSEKGHKWSEGTVVPCSCTDEGVKEYTCSECGKTDTHVIDAADHKAGTPHRENEVTPTCTQPGGYDLVTRCKVCNAIISSVPVEEESIGHSWGEAQEVETSDPDHYCYDTIVKCTVCDAEQEGSRQHHDHDWGEWTVTTPAQAGVAGEETRVCYHNSSHKETREIPALTSITIRTYRAYYENSRYETTTTTRAIYPVGSTVTISWNSNTNNAYIVDAYVNATRTDVPGGWYGHDYYISGNSVPVSGSGRYYSVNLTVTQNMTVDLRSRIWQDYPTNISVTQSRSASAPADSAGTKTASAGAKSIKSLDERSFIKSEPSRAGNRDAVSMSQEALNEYLNGLGAEGDATCREAEGAVHTYKEELDTYTISADDGWTKLIDELPKYNEYGKEYKYYFVETDPTSGYEISYTGQDSGLQSDDSATVINKKLFGSLNITKTIKVSGGKPAEDAFPSGTYDFPVQVSTTINGTVYYVQDVNGTLATTPPATPLKVSSGSLNNAGTALTISHLPYGTYTVSEIQPDSVEVPGFSFVVQETGPGGEVHFQSVISGEGTVNEDAGQVDLLNYYRKGASWTPEVDKKLNGASHSGNAAGYSGYTFTLTEPEGQNTIHPRPGQPNTHSMTAVTDEDGRAVFDKIDYHLHGNQQSAEYSYTITEIRPAGAQNEPYIDDDILYDTSTIYVLVTVSKTGNGPNMVTEAHANYYSDAAHTKPLQAVVFDNTELASLSVTKTVSGDYTPTSGDTFPITIKKGEQFLNSAGKLVDEDPHLTIKDGQTLNFTNIPAGTYVVTEGDANKPGFSLSTTYTSQVGTQTSQTNSAALEKGDEGSVAITNTYHELELTIVKIDEATRTSAEQTTLPQAKFKLYKYTVPEGGGTGTYTVYPDEDSCERTTDGNGRLTFDGFTDGRYRIDESAQPEGYVLEEPLQIYFTVENGVITWTNEAGTEIQSQNLVSYSPADTTFTVGNVLGVALPYAGGLGTTWIYILGVIMILGAGVLLIARRRITG